LWLSRGGGEVKTHGTVEKEQVNERKGGGIPKLWGGGGRPGPDTKLKRGGLVKMGGAPKKRKPESKYLKREGE